MQRIAQLIVLACVLSGPIPTHAFSADTLTRAVRSFFPSAPEMVDIARCESGLRQYDASGKALRGGYSGKMIGLFQLNETYHRAAALSLGYNIDTLLGNLAYARELWKTEGTDPWWSSAHCWEKQQPVASSGLSATTSAATASVVVMNTEKTLTKTLRFGMRDAEVGILQSLLRKSGHLNIPDTDEVNYFGVRTYKALIAFQCAEGIACLSVPTKRVGVGIVDTRTAQALLNKSIL